MLQGWQCFVELRTLQSFPIARARFDELQEVLPGHNLQDLLSADMLPESVAEQQVMLFVFSMVLVDLLQRVGLEIAGSQCRGAPQCACGRGTDSQRSCAAHVTWKQHVCASFFEVWAGLV